MSSSNKNPFEKLRYCESFYSYRRRKTRIVKIGSVPIGGHHPIRIQSMTTTLASNADATVNQTIRLVKAGCEIVRIAVPTIEEAKNLKTIKKALLKKKIKVPLVADVHFLPAAAMESAEHVEKVRINPGNFSDSKLFKTKDYSDHEYRTELEKVEERFTPSVLKMKKLERAMRIGVNHGSLSDGIMSRYGDTPLGMVESALEFVRICEKNNYHDIVLSMKSSNVKVMIAAYRLLAAKMSGLGMDYPFHLGVTEAGEGEDGRIKSAIGIGSLLEEGIGDTIRVSLSEEPEKEIPVCIQIAGSFNERKDKKSPVCHPSCYIENPYHYARNKTVPVRIGPFSLGGDNPLRVVSDFDPYLIEKQLLHKTMKPEIIQWSVRTQKDLKALESCISTMSKNRFPVAFLGRFENCPDCLEKGLSMVQCALFKYGTSDDAKTRKNEFVEFVKKAKEKNIPVMLESGVCKDHEKLEKTGDLTPAYNILAGMEWAESLGMDQIIISFNLPDREQMIHNVRLIAGELKSRNRSYPIHLKLFPQVNGNFDDMRIDSSIALGTLLCDGIGDSIQIGSSQKPKEKIELAYNILQASGVRITKTEYISCPACGRTLFDIKSTIEKIRARTGHLQGVKIAIMGCIVNGPGEMADAHFGYVGGSPGKINLYVGKECVQKNIPSEIAVEKLIELIKQRGRWQEK